MPFADDPEHVCVFLDKVLLEFVFEIRPNRLAVSNPEEHRFVMAGFLRREGGGFVLEDLNREG